MKPRPSQVDKGLIAIRKQTHACGQCPSYAALYREAEKLQHMVHDFKTMIANGGTWAENHQEEE